MAKCHQDLESKTNALDSELEKVKSSEVSTQTVSEKNKVSNVKQEESEYNIKEKHKAIPCKYFHRKMECRKGDKCWFFHGDDHITEKNSTKVKQKENKQFKDEPKLDKKFHQEQGFTLMQGILELLKLILKENNI